ncbi:MAG TPA: hypothetical protein VHW44_17055 [Pseudonocardiaceae bacterium]|jgi:hypothetical protein|nr:hypothetical protein [Pseudonocardiaceae bacterium]
MRFAGSQSWQISWGNERAVDTALFLRDTLALSVETDPDLPLLAPSVPVVVPPGVDRKAVAAEWPSWWADVLTFTTADHNGDPAQRFAALPIRPESAALTVRPAIRQAIVALQAETARYFGDQSRANAGRPQWVNGPAPHEIVQDLELSLGRTARPFRLVVTEIPVAGAVWLRLADEHVLASTEFLKDHNRSTPALRAVLAELA